MQPPAWQLDKHFARLRCGRFRATVDVTRPADGLVEVCPGSDRLTDACLLGIAIPSYPAGDATALIEDYARGGDLTAAYKESQDWPVRVDAFWRAAGPAQSEKFAAAVELVVSVRTQEPDSRPELAAESRLSASETLHLVDKETADYRPLAAAAATVIRPEDGTGCLLFRPPGVELSYAEAVHPTDFQRDELISRSGGVGTVLLRHHLFANGLEKGVILRARVAGVFLPREGDRYIAARWYQAFAAAEPSLK